MVGEPAMLWVPGLLLITFLFNLVDEDECDAVSFLKTLCAPSVIKLVNCINSL